MTPSPGPDADGFAPSPMWRGLVAKLGANPPAQDVFQTLMTSLRAVSNPDTDREKSRNFRMDGCLAAAELERTLGPGAEADFIARLGDILLTDWDLEAIELRCHVAARSREQFEAAVASSEEASAQAEAAYANLREVSARLAALS